MASTGFPTVEQTQPAPEVVELQLLLPRWQAQALEEAARARGMTTGQVLRRVIADLFVAGPAAGR
jgi:hypothetical protein